MNNSIIERLFGPFITTITEFFKVFPLDISLYLVALIIFVIVIAVKRVFLN